VLGPPVSVSFQVTDDGGTRSPAPSSPSTARLPACAVTGADGKAKVEIPLGAVDTVAGVHVRPRDGAWSVTLRHPRLSLTRPNEIECTQLEHTVPVAGTSGMWGTAGTVRQGKTALAFPETAAASWGRLAMGFDRVPRPAPTWDAACGSA